MSDKTDMYTGRTGAGGEWRWRRVCVCVWRGEGGGQCQPNYLNPQALLFTWLLGNDYSYSCLTDISDFWRGNLLAGNPRALSRQDICLCRAAPDLVWGGIQELSPEE